MTANEQFLDAMIRHQIFLMRLSGKVRNDIFKLLEATEADMRAEILRRLKNIGDGGLTPGNVRKMNALIKVLKAMRQQAWKQAEQVWIDEMLDLAKSEPAFVAGLTKTVAPVTLSLDLPTARQLRAIVTSRPFEGRTMRTWAKTLAPPICDGSKMRSRSDLCRTKPMHRLHAASVQLRTSARTTPPRSPGQL
jgi:predicted GNAT family acetyltransferase